MKSKLKFLRRKNRIRFVLKTSDRPRLVVFKSRRHLYVQIIDNVTSNVLTAASSLETTIKDKGNKSNYCNKDTAVKIGKLIAQRAQVKSVTKVVFDRAGYKYHGVVKSLADEARKILNF